MVRGGVGGEEGRTFFKLDNLIPAKLSCDDIEREERERKRDIHW